MTFYTLVRQIPYNVNVTSHKEDYVRPVFVSSETSLTNYGVEGRVIHHPYPTRLHRCQVSGTGWLEILTELARKM